MTRQEERAKSWLQMHGAAVESAERICRNFRDSGSTPETWVGLLEGMERTTLMLMIDEVRCRHTRQKKAQITVDTAVQKQLWQCLCVSLIPALGIRTLRNLLLVSLRAGPYSHGAFVRPVGQEVGGGGTAGGADGARGWPDGQGQLRRGARPQPSRAHCLAFLYDMSSLLLCIRLFATTKHGTTGATLLGCFVQLLSDFSMATSLVVHLTRWPNTFTRCPSDPFRCPPADSFAQQRAQALTVYRQVLAEDPDHDEARRGVAEAEKGQRLATMSEEEMMAAVQKMQLHSDIGACRWCRSCTTAVTSPQVCRCNLPPCRCFVVLMR